MLFPSGPAGSWLSACACTQASPCPDVCSHLGFSGLQAHQRAGLKSRYLRSLFRPATCPGPLHGNLMGCLSTAVGSRARGSLCLLVWHLSPSRRATSCLPSSFPFELQICTCPSAPPLWRHLEAPCAAPVSGRIPSALPWVCYSGAPDLCTVSVSPQVCVGSWSHCPWPPPPSSASLLLAILSPCLLSWPHCPAPAALWALGSVLTPASLHMHCAAERPLCLQRLYPGAGLGEVPPLPAGI